jgi:hypothetical protein
VLILLWLVPPAVVTVVAALWVSWLGREGRGEVDPDVAVRRLAAAMERERPRHPVVRRAPQTPSRQPAERPHGVAVRRRAS